jgi:hypothetical protein
MVENCGFCRLVDSTIGCLSRVTLEASFIIFASWTIGVGTSTRVWGTSRIDSILVSCSSSKFIEFFLVMYFLHSHNQLFKFLFPHALLIQYQNLCIGLCFLLVGRSIDLEFNLLLVVLYGSSIGVISIQVMAK